MTPLRGALAGALLALVVAAGCESDKPERPARVPGAVPRSFVGLVSEDVYAGDRRYRAATLARQRAAGVGLMRQTIDWAGIETEPGVYRFGFLDRYVAALARRRIELLPVLFNAPRFHSSAPRRNARRGAYPPRRPAALGDFAAALARRYGPHGRFWRRHPELPAVPVRAWQVWNEPNLPVYWASGPDARGYVALVEAAARGIHEADPRAEIVSAGIAQSRLGVPFNSYVRAMYRAGAGSVVDSFAIHPYAAGTSETVAAVAATRDLLAELGARPPIWITEVGWASGGPRSPFTVGESGQARRIDALFAELAERRRALGLRGVVYFNWKDAPPYPGGRDFFGLHTGLLRRDGASKPALRAFERAAGKLSQ